MSCALAFFHVVSVVINQYSVIRHSFSLFEVGDMISLLKCWNERPHSRAEHFGVDIGKRIARRPLQIAAPKCPVADWPSDTFCSRRWATKSQPAFFNRGKQPSFNFTSN